MKSWDVIIIGGGHAGCEAAVACAKMGSRAALLTLNPERIGFMSCNPAVGGLAKGQLVKEIDALGGVMGMNTDKAAIQYKRLNSSKGPAVRSSRAQCDKALYAMRMQEYVSAVPNLTVLRAEAVDIKFEAGRVVGLEIQDGTVLRCRAVVVTAGTFLRAVMHTGDEWAPGGRAGDPAAEKLSSCFEGLGMGLRRLKTGTPPRLNKNSINFSVLEENPGDQNPVPFSFYYRADRFPVLPQVSCHIAYTSPKTHEIIEKNISRSPMFTGAIRGVGPRYCPSIEDKVSRFRDKSRHQLFLEPEGLTTDEVYVNGISTSLPRDVQYDFVRSVSGLENAEFMRFGYAVEYDAIDSTRLRSTLEVKDVPGLFFAGQINGTSGYEEAGAQGLIAGINAALRAKDLAPFSLTRHDGYIGVLIDDLVLKGSDEPYRMFTSRAEHRLLLREDNADLRLSPMGRSLGLLCDAEWAQFTSRRDAIESWRQKLAATYFYPCEETNAWFARRGLSALKDRVSADALLKRPEMDWGALVELGIEGGDAVRADVREQVETQVKYAGYIQRDLDTLEGVRKSETLVIPDALDFDRVPGLSAEIRGRLKAVRPETIGQASRLMGITPAAVATLMIHIKMRANGHA